METIGRPQTPEELYRGTALEAEIPNPGPASTRGGGTAEELCGALAGEKGRGGGGVNLGILVII